MVRLLGDRLGLSLPTGAKRPIENPALQGSEAVALDSRSGLRPAGNDINSDATPAAVIVTRELDPLRHRERSVAIQSPPLPYDPWIASSP
jgi:hypothetical protein